MASQLPTSTSSLNSTLEPATLCIQNSKVFSPIHLCHQESVPQLPPASISAPHQELASNLPSTSISAPHQELASQLPTSTSSLNLRLDKDLTQKRVSVYDIFKEELQFKEELDIINKNDMIQWESNRLRLNERETIRKRNLKEQRIEKARIDHRRLAQKKWIRESIESTKLDDIEYHILQRKYYSKLVAFHRREELRLRGIKEENLNKAEKKQYVHIKEPNAVEKLKKLKLTNGGDFVIGKKKYNSINTCSIDYFLIIIYLLIESSNNLGIFEKNSGNCFFKIYAFIAENDWHMARYEWFKFCPSLKIIQKGLKFNWFMSEFDSYLRAFQKYQTYYWEENCDNEQKPNCFLRTKITKESSCFIFRFVIFNLF